MDIELNVRQFHKNMKWTFKWAIILLIVLWDGDHTDLCYSLGAYCTVHIILSYRILHIHVHVYVQSTYTMYVYALSSSENSNLHTCIYTCTYTCRYHNETSVVKNVHATVHETIALVPTSHVWFWPRHHTSNSHNLIHVWYAFSIHFESQFDSLDWIMHAHEI